MKNDSLLDGDIENEHSIADKKLQELLVAPKLPRTDVDFVNEVQKAVAARRKFRWTGLPVFASLGTAVAMLFFFGGVKEAFNLDNDGDAAEVGVSVTNGQPLIGESQEVKTNSSLAMRVAIDVPLDVGGDEDWEDDLEDVLQEVEDASLAARALFLDVSFDAWSASAVGTDEGGDIDDESENPSTQERDFGDEGIAQEQMDDFSSGALLADALTGYGQPAKERVLFDLDFDLDAFSDDELYFLDEALDAS